MNVGEIEVHVRLVFRSGVAALLGLVLVGCGGAEDAPPIQPVSGTVTFNGQPVNEGDVNFISDQGFATSAPLENGRYELNSQYGAGIPAGNYKVSISPPPAEGNVTIDGPAPPEKEYPNIPKKYRDFTTSGFTATIAGDEAQSFDFEMVPE